MTRFGFVEAGDAEHVIVFPSVLDEALQKAGFSPKKTRRWLAANERINTTTESGGRVRDTVQRRINGVRTWMIRLSLGGDPVPDQDGFVEVPNDEIPF